MVYALEAAAANLGQQDIIDLVHELKLDVQGKGPLSHSVPLLSPIHNAWKAKYIASLIADRTGVNPIDVDDQAPPVETGDRAGLFSGDPGATASVLASDIASSWREFSDSLAPYLKWTIVGGSVLLGFLAYKELRR